MARTYKRDSRGRFAGGGGGGGGGGKSRPAPRQIQRGVNRLTRDNAGRITSVGGSGATARGGRIRTAAGNLRATTTAKISRTKASGTVAKPRKLNADKNAAVKLATNQRLRARAAARGVDIAKPQAKPAANKRVTIKADLRPKNLFSRATKQTPGYGTDAKANIANARRQVEAKGIKTALKSNKRSSTVASVNQRTPNQIDFNASHPSWRNPRASSIKDRRSNLFATGKAGHVVAHELGHIRHSPGKLANSWDTQLRGKGQIYADADKVVSAQRVATRVSKYARTSPAEFAAEARAGLSLGKKYDRQVMQLYRKVTGAKPSSIKSQLNLQNSNTNSVSLRARRKRKS